MHSKEKIKKIRERALLREYISLHLSKVIKEQDDGYYGDYDDTGIMVGGFSEPGAPSKSMTDFLTKSDFARLFGFDSIKNSVDTAVYGLRSIGTKAGGELKLFWKSLLWTIVPFIKSDKYDNILEMAEDDREKIENKLERLDSKYAEVIKQNEEIFNNPDFNFAMFLAAPGVVVGTEVVDKTLKGASNLYDALVGPDESKNRYGREADQLFKSLMPSFGLNPENPEDLRKIRQTILEELQLQFPNLTSDQLDAVVGQAVSETLREQFQQLKTRSTAEQPVDPLQAKVKNFLMSKEGQVWSGKFMNTIDGLKKYLSSPVAQQKMNGSQIVKSGQQILANEIVEAATKSLSKFDMNYLKTNHMAEINKFFEEQGIKDPAEREKILNDPEGAKEVTETLRSILKKPYMAQLDVLEKMNPTELRPIVNASKKQIDVIATGKA
jgi:hypothetical protein